MSSADTAPQKTFVDQLKAGVPQKIVYYGTSLTAAGAWSQQFTAVLDKQFPKLVTTKNLAVSGQHSGWGIQNVQKVVAEKPDVVFIEFTTNDATERFNISIADARKNTEGIIDQIKAANPACEIILQIMNPVIDRPKGHQGHRPDLPGYWQMYRDLGKERGLLVIDHSPAWLKLLDAGEAAYKKYVPDGLHPNGDGYKNYMLPTLIETFGLQQSK